MCEDHDCCLLLQNATSYQPDTLDLNKDEKAAEYWFPCFREMVAKFAQQAATSQKDEDKTAAQRATQFQTSYLVELDNYQQNREHSDKVLGISKLLELNSILLRRFGFDDPWMKQKRIENSTAILALKTRLKEIDALTDNDIRWTELVRGMLAGNMFDWGAQAVANILNNDSNFGLHAALERIEKRPWLIDNLDSWLQRLHRQPVHKCAAIFVDNSGVDVVLGVLPFARELLRRGTKVMLCANTSPALNDVTHRELRTLLDEVCTTHCAILADAWCNKRLQVHANGQYGPCLDMRTLPHELSNALKTNETDLLVIEGMGRALHTNLYAKFNCETVKLAVVKNQWLAKYLGGDIFAVMCKYETPALS